MKRQIFKVLTLIFALVLVFALPMSAEEYLTGDMNGDGVVNTDDAIYLLRHVLNKEQYELACNHNLTAHEAKAPTCTEIGWEAYETCSRCSYTTYKESRALDHNYVDGICLRCKTPKTSTGLEYSLGYNNQYCYITGIGLCTDTALVIPNQIDGYIVNFIASSAFADCKQIESVIISDGVKSIGKLAFANCTSLKKVIIPDSITSADGGIFYGCIALEDVVLGKGIKELKHAEIRTTTNNVTTTKTHGMFEGCVALSKIEIPTTVIKIGKFAFANCSSIENIVIPESVNTIDESAFYKCISLNNITIPNSVNAIGDWSFAHCSSLETVILPDNLTEISEFLFEKCTSLKTIAIPAVHHLNLSP